MSVMPATFVSFTQESKQNWRRFYAKLQACELFEYVPKMHSVLRMSYELGQRTDQPIFHLHRVARVDGQWIGIGTVGLTRGGHTVINVYVKPAFRRQGIGTTLVRTLQRRFPYAQGVRTASAGDLYVRLGVPNFKGTDARPPLFLSTPATL